MTPPTPTTRWRWVEWVNVALVGLASLLVWAQAMTSLFSQDDLLVLEQAVGLRSATLSLWRILSGPVLFRALHLSFGMQASGYHLLVLALHTSVGVASYVLLRRATASSWSALLGATIIVCTPLAYTVLLQATGVGEVLAALLLLFAYLLLEARVAGAQVAGAVLACASVLAKETSGLPSLILLGLAVQRRSGRLTTWSCLLGFVGVASFLSWLVLGRTGLPSLNGDSYVIRWSSSVGGLGWYFSQLARWSDVSPDLRGQAMIGGQIGGALAIVLLALVAWPDRGARVFACCAIGAVLPVLPLVNHRFVALLYPVTVFGVLALTLALHRMLEGPLLSLALRRRASGTALRVGAVFALLAFVTASGWRVNHWLGATRESELPRDPILRRMVIADIAVRSFCAEVPTLADSVVIVQPTHGAVGIHSDGRVVSVAAGTPTRNLSRLVLDNGQVLRLYRPQLRSVEWSEGRPDRLGLRHVVVLDGMELRYMGVGEAAASNAPNR